MSEVNGVADKGSRPSSQEIVQNDRNSKVPLAVQEELEKISTQLLEEKTSPLIENAPIEKPSDVPTETTPKPTTPTTEETTQSLPEAKVSSPVTETPPVTSEKSSPLKENPETVEESSPQEGETVKEPSKEVPTTTTSNGHTENGTDRVVLVAAPPPKKYEIIAVRERHGLFRKAVPVMPLIPAVIFCLINVVTPGIGTLFAAFTVLCGCPTEHENRPKAFCYNVVAAILQLITAPIVVGWVWSIFWGVTFVNVSVSKGADDTITVPVASSV